MSKFNETVFKAMKYNPSKNQKKLHDCGLRYRSIVGPERSGKNRAVIHEIIRWLCWPVRKEIVIIGETLEKPKKILDKIHDLLINNIPLFVKQYANNTGLMMIHDSTVRITTARNPIGLMGQSFDFVVIVDADSDIFTADFYNRNIAPRILSTKGHVLTVSKKSCFRELIRKEIKF